MSRRDPTAIEAARAAITRLRMRSAAIERPLQADLLCADPANCRCRTGSTVDTSSLAERADNAVVVREKGWAMCSQTSRASRPPQSRCVLSQRQRSLRGATVARPAGRASVSGTAITRGYRRAGLKLLLLQILPGRVAAPYRRSR